MSISDMASPSTASPTGVEEDVAKMTEEHIEAGATVDGKITLAEVDRMTSHPIDIMGDEVLGQWSGYSCHISDAEMLDIHLFVFFWFTLICCLNFGVAFGTCY